MPVAKMGGRRGFGLVRRMRTSRKRSHSTNELGNFSGLIVLRCCRSTQTRPTISGGGNGEKREARSDRGLSDAEKMERFADDWYHEPAVFVEAFLYGLSAARNKLANSP
jgi:hypothetical protein